MSTYYAHVRKDPSSGDVVYQTVEEHLAVTAAMCAGFAADFGAGDVGYLTGLAHDMGKCSPGFQNRLLRGGAVVDHSTAGAVACAKLGHIHPAACVAGHHSGLPDFGNLRTSESGDPTLYGRLKKGIAGKYLESCGDSGTTLPQLSPDLPWSDTLRLSYWTRMLYSCLVDADFLDTERFMNGDLGRGQHDDIPALVQRLNSYISRWKDPKTELDKLRCRMLKACIDNAAGPKGVYTLTMPTGGGKTIASLAFALHHAMVHQMKRVIYVIPYTSIIEQNARVFRDILGDNNVLEHHSGVELDLSEGADTGEMRQALAAENWDMPVVVTTAVRFFESIYSARGSKCRKLHNLANSVIIFDEAQMLPLDHLRPCVAAIASLAEQFRSTVVLCTATQPVLEDLLQTYAPGLPVTELCPQASLDQEAFRRVTFKQAGTIGDDALALNLSAHRQVLCIVNSRKAAQSIFDLLPAEDGTFHLSTLMTPAHRQMILDEIRCRLTDGKTCRVVSTSLMEAGVDVDFPAVYRELAGLDSVIQAAGRCNREGRRSADESIVTVFERAEQPPRMFGTFIGAARLALADGRDPGDPDAISGYFRHLRSLSDKKLDAFDVIKAFQQGINGCSFPFKTVASSFHLINDNTHTVYIPYGGGAELVQRLENGECSRELYRKLSRYAVSVYDQHFQALYAAGALLTAKDVPSLDDSSGILADMTLYSASMGLSLEADTGKAEFI